MRFSPAFLDELTARTDFLSLVGAYVQKLKPQSGGRYIACCPFHSEKTPSFSITPAQGLYYCFGCHAGGGVIQFVMQAENLGFKDAVLFLCQRAGITPPADDNPAETRRIDRLRLLNKTAARFFYDTLQSSNGEPCRLYMQERGIHPGLAKRFGLGAASDEWDALARAAKAKGFSEDELLAAGLCTRGKKGGLIDAFRSRLMFPIFNLRGDVIAFSGRLLPGAIPADANYQPPKYKNSPETALYKKRDTLFGAHLAKTTKHPEWILTEGNLDVFILHQYGFDNAVATCGTALTAAQARLMARLTKAVVICYDSDPAGKAAAQKALPLLEEAGVQVRVLLLPGAKDPDEYMRRYGPDAFAVCLRDATGDVAYRLLLLEESRDLNLPDDKLAYLKDAVALIAGLHGEAERQIYASAVAEKLKIDRESILRDVALSRKRGNQRKERAQMRVLARPARGEMPQAEKILLAILLHRDDLHCSLSPDDLQDASARSLFLSIQNGENPLLNAETAALAAELRANPPFPDVVNLEEALADCIQKIQFAHTETSAERMENYRKKKSMTAQ